MAARTAWLLLAIPAVPLLCLQLRSAGLNPGWKDIFLLGGRGLLFLAIVTLIILVTTPWLTPQAPEVCLTVTEDENKRRQKRVREKQQETLSTKSSGYLKNVLKPRQETKLRKQEESFYQMMGETWKSLDGYKLGEKMLTERSESGDTLLQWEIEISSIVSLSQGYEEPSLASENGASDDTPNREASRRRKLPEHVNHAPASPQQPRAKKGFVIPEEPPETAEEVVAIALRCPDGRVLRRRFCKTWSSQVLLDWMMKVGYHKSIYTLSTSYPRRPLEVGEDQTLEDAGLTTDTVLNVEEREPCPSL